MADPTIQTFCCHHVTLLRDVSAQGDVTADLLLEQFHSLEYNAVCIACATVGIVGAVYQILPRKVSQARNIQASRGREIISWLAGADLMASIGVFIRSAVWLLLGSAVPQINSFRTTVFCAISSAWTQYFYTCTWLWTLAYAIDVRRSLKGKPFHKMWTHVLCWTIPAIMTSAGLVVLYTPDADCQGDRTPYTALRILPTFCVTYVPILVVMTVNPLLYFLASKDVLRILTLTSGQVTNKERSATNAVTIKFLVINMSFYICWLPNLVNGILLWALWLNLPPTVILVLWYIMAVTNPLQAALNALVYRQRRGGSDALRLPCCGPERMSNADAPDETMPLVDTNPDSQDLRPNWSLNRSSCSYL